MANKKKRAPWGSKKRAQEEASAAGAEAGADLAGDGAAPAAPAPPTVGEAIENVKNWLAPFDVDTRRSILKAVGVFLK